MVSKPLRRYCTPWRPICVDIFCRARARRVRRSGPLTLGMNWSGALSLRRSRWGEERAAVSLLGGERAFTE